MNNYNSLMIVRKYNNSGEDYFVGELLVQTDNPNINIIEDRYVLNLKNKDIDDLSLITFHMDDIYIISNNYIKLLPEGKCKEYMEKSPFEFFLNEKYEISLNSYDIISSNLEAILAISNLKDEEYERYINVDKVNYLKGEPEIIKTKEHFNLRNNNNNNLISNESPLKIEYIDFIKDFAEQPKENNVLLYIDKNNPESLEILDLSGKLVYSADNLAMNLFGWDDEEAFKKFIIENDDIITEDNKLYCLEVSLYDSEYGLEHDDLYVFDENNEIFEYEEYKSYNENLKM